MPRCESLPYVPVRPRLRALPEHEASKSGRFASDRAASEGTPQLCLMPFFSFPAPLP